MLIWPEASNAQNSIATYHQCGRAAASGGSRRRRFCHRPTPPPASPSGDTPLNRLIGNELRRTSSVVLGIGFDNTPEGKLVPKFQTGSTENKGDSNGDHYHRRC